MRECCAGGWNQGHLKESQTTHRAILITPRVVLLHPHEKDQDRNKCLDGIGPSSQRHVRASDVVVGGHVASGDAREERSSAQLDMLHRLQRHCRLAIPFDNCDKGKVAYVWGHREEHVRAISKSKRNNPNSCTAILIRTRQRSLYLVSAPFHTANFEPKSELVLISSTHATSSALFPSFSAFSCSLIALFWTSEYRTFKTE